MVTRVPGASSAGRARKGGIEWTWARVLLVGLVIVAVLVTIPLVIAMVVVG